MLYVCPVALVGIVAAAVLLVAMILGSMQLYDALQAEAKMADYVDHLSWNNSLKKAEYEASLDLDKIYRDALAFGFISQELVPHLEIPVE
jgi:hypothetical protein